MRSLLTVLVCISGMLTVNGASRSITPGMSAAHVADVFRATSHGDTIRFSAGAFSTACGLSVSSANVTISGMGKDLTVLNCTDQRSRHFALNGSNVLIENLSLIGGFGDCFPSNSSECGNCQCGRTTFDGGNGGCVSITSSATLRNVVVSRCASRWNGGGIAAATGSRLVLQGVKISECHGGDGGGLHVDSLAKVTLEETVSFEDNTASNSGGAVYLSGGHVSAQHTVRFSRNSAWNGGAISALAASTVILSESVVLNDNLCSVSGGAMYLVGSTMTATNGVEFDGNSASYGGAVLAVGGSVVSISNSVNITANFVGSTGMGGGLFFHNSFAEIHGNVSIRWNSAFGHFGGGWAQGASSVTVADAVVLADNSARYGGGAAYGYSGGSMVIENSVELRGNAGGQRGGAVYTSGLGDLTVRNKVVFDGNFVSQSGGAIYSYAGSVTITDDVVGRNSGPVVTGGFLHAVSNTVHFNGVEIFGMEAPTGFAGAVYLDRGASLFADKAFMHHCSAFHGGAVTIKENSRASFSGDVRIADNIAAHNGGAFYSFLRSALLLQGPGVILDNNAAMEWGSTVYIQEDSTLHILDGAVIKNSGHSLKSSWVDPTIHGVGGAVHAVMRALVVLHGAVILNNTARTGAVADLDNHARVVITNTRIEGNLAGDRGGVLNVYHGSTAEIGTGAMLTSNSAFHLGGAVSVSNDASVTILDGAVLAGNQVLMPRWSCPLLPCGGGAVHVGDVGTLTLKDGAVLRGNTADIGGGVLMMEKASATVTGAVVAMNSANDGAGFAALNESSLALVDSECIQNSAVVAGGCVFHSGLSLQLSGQNTLQSNSASNGGGMFLFSGVDFLGTTGSESLLRKNRASVQGGGIELVGSLAIMRVNATHRLVLEENIAGVHGGGLAISLGGAMRVEEEVCPNDCASSIRGDGLCQPQCMSAACNWDEGDCDAVMVSAGEDAMGLCDRSICSYFNHWADCSDQCFHASCDFHRITCQTEKARMRECPLYDATVFASVRQQPSLIYMRGGNAGGYGRCANDTCLTPDVVTTDLSRTTGAWGSSALSVSDETAWVMIPEAEELQQEMAEVTIDAWVKIDPEMSQRGYVVSWEHFGLFVAPFGGGKFHFGVESGPKFSGSGNWRKCVDREPTIMTEAYGLITDGIFDYDANLDCKFILAPVRPEGCAEDFKLTLTFHLLDVETNWDYVYVSDCSDIECTSKTQLQALTGNYDPFTIVSSTGILEVTFLVDQVVNAAGFVATFDARPATANKTLSGVFAPDEWHHISVSMDSAGSLKYYLDGEWVSSDHQAPLRSSSFEGGWALGQRYMGPELGQHGRFRGQMDEVRVWEGLHDSVEDWTLGCSDSNVTATTGLVLCYGFDEGNGSSVGNAVDALSGAGRGVVGDKHLPWCITSDDDGMRVIPGTQGSRILLGPGWGFCSPQKPRLPGASFEYDVKEMDDVSGMTMAQLLYAYPRCGGHPLQFKDNHALEGNGGGVYQADCDSAADARGLCFFTGMAAGGGGMTLASFINNHAGGAGGAAYVECRKLGASCNKSTSLVLPWPLSDEAQLKINLGRNSAGTRAGVNANDVATSPSRLLLPSDEKATQLLTPWSAPMQLMYVPGQMPLNLSVTLVDDLQSLVISTPIVPNTYYVEALLCSIDGPCSAAAALQPSTLHRFSRTDGDPMSRTINGEQEVLCPVGQSEVRIKMSLVGALEVPARMITISCLPCEVGQSRQELVGNGGVRLWRCISCDLDQYVVDPNKNTCRDCPSGAACDGSSLVGLVAGSTWEADNSDGIYRLRSCPAGYQLINSINNNFVELQQQCSQCTPQLQYIVDPTKHECKDCPVGAVCDGSSLVGAVGGSVWEVDDELGIYRLVTCPQRHQLVNASGGVFAELAQQCQPCKEAIEYIVNPNSGSCTPCPIGWESGCDAFETSLVTEGEISFAVNPEDNSAWEVVDGLLRLIECSEGKILIRSELHPESDQCAECAPDSFSEGRAFWYDDGQPLVASLASGAQARCINCVKGAKCPGGTLGETVTGFWRNTSNTPATVGALQTRRRAVASTGVPVEEVTAPDVGVYPCPPHACVDGKCAEGREGVVCGVCKEGYAMAYGTCTRCETGSEVTRPILAVVILVLAAIALYVGGYIPIFGAEPDEEIKTMAAPASKLTAVRENMVKMFKASRSALPFLGWGKIIISFYQVLSSYIQTFPVNWPVRHTSFMENSAVARFDFMAQPGLNCLAGNYNYKERIIVYLMSLPTVLFVFTLPTLYVVFVGTLKYKGWKQHPRFNPVIHQFLWMTLFVIFIVYPTLSVVTLRSFNCQDIGEFGRKLTVDFREDCPKDHKTGFIFIWSLLFTALYPAGIPLFFFIVLLVYQVPQMARAKIKEAMVAALISQYKRRTALALANNLQEQLGLAQMTSFPGDSDEESGRERRKASLPKKLSLIGKRTSTTNGQRHSMSKVSSLGSVGSITAETAMRGLAAAQLAEDDRVKLRGLVEKHATPGANGQAPELDYNTFNAMLGDLMAEQTQFSGLERLDATSDNRLSREQMKALIMFDWLRQNEGGVERGRTLSASDAPPTPDTKVSGAMVYGQPGTPKMPRRRSSVITNLKKRGSLFRTSTVDDPRHRELDMMSDDQLRNRVKDIADKLREARVIAIPHLEWNGDLGEQEQQAISHIGFLFKNYRVECWYYELLEIIRKLITTAVRRMWF